MGNLGHSASEATWARALGGEDVADAPNSSADLASFRGNPLSALTQGEAAFATAYSTSGHQPTAMFLVGGPGAGKSSAAKSLLAGYGEVQSKSSDFLAKRAHLFRKEQRSVLLVNDATMTHSTGRESTLLADIAWSEAEDSDILVCVNRGILAEESVSSPTSSSDALISMIANECELPLPDHYKIVAEGEGFVQLQHTGSGHHKNIIAVYLDSKSLLDPPSGSDSENLLDSPGGKMIGAVFSSLSDEKGRRDLPGPIAANIHDMSNPKIFHNFLKVLRASEAAVGSYMNYRTIWAVIARCAFGSLPEVNSFDQRFNSLDKDLTNLTWTKLQELASLRSHQALFGADDGKALPAFRQAEKNPIRYLHAVDPVFSSIELIDHYGTEEAPNAEPWSQIVFDAFFGSSEKMSPLNALEQSLEDDNPFHKYVSEFERLLDQKYLNEMASTDLESTRQNWTSWYSQYLLRAYALSNGHVGFEQEIAILRELKENPGPVPTIHEFEKSFRAMLRPSRYSEKSGGVALLSVFESRIAPILGDLEEPKLAIRANDVVIRSETRGNDSFLVMTERGQSIGSIIVDLPLVHEVLTWRGGMQGMSEASRLVSPRIERLRAAKLASGYLEREPNSLVIALERDEVTIVFRKAEK
jgi:hypothetical protein